MTATHLRSGRHFPMQRRVAMGCAGWRKPAGAALALAVLLLATPDALHAAGAPAFDIKLDTISTGFDKKSCWVHPRTGAIPGAVPKIVLTMNKAAIVGSDIFGPLNEMRSDDLGKTWSGPVEHARTLGPREEPGRVKVTPSDFWPKWHAKSGKLLGIGHDVRYQDNKVMRVRARETVFSIYDPAQRTWTDWETLAMPDTNRFHNAGAGCVQRVDLPDGDILLPVYFTPKGETTSRVAVLRCGFDGRRLSVKQIGNELRVDEDRGLHEPSLTRFKGRYYLTIRHDQRAYVTTSNDGLHFGTLKSWTWDDGTDLGSYNTQAHWVTHDDGLFLCYTRRGAMNDHIPRHRAPLFIGQVDPGKLHVIRATERVLMPQRGAKLGNFGVTEVNENETWVTDAEWMQTTGPNYADFTQCTKYGSDNAVFAARIQWRKPSTTWNQR
ncbi:MAG: sialidase family protein [Limisphaerales bacterium]